MAAKGATYLSLLLVVSTSVLLALRLLASFPLPPEPLAIYPSLASLPEDSRSWKIYPEDFFEGGKYVTFPFGKVHSNIYHCFELLIYSRRFDIGLWDLRTGRRCEQ